jgi:hypothetical protein
MESPQAIPQGEGSRERNESTTSPIYPRRGAAKRALLLVAVFVAFSSKRPILITHHVHFRQARSFDFGST